MNNYKIYDAPKTDRITRLVDRLLDAKPQLESERAVLLTESYKNTESLPIS